MPDERAMAAVSAGGLPALIFEKGVPGTGGVSLVPREAEWEPAWEARLRRARPPDLPELPESEVVRHYTRLSQLNFSVDTHFYPLGSCTMKYNPKACERVASWAAWGSLHPVWPQLPRGEDTAQGALQLLYEVERWLAEITGMAEFTLQPLAGAHGELTAALIMAAYHRDRGARKTHLLIPDSAHGTNPASAAVAGYRVVSVPSDAQGNVDLGALRAQVNEETAGLMLTCPNTLGVFDPGLPQIVNAVHAVGGLVYYDGANLNALLGRCKPGEMGFDLCHLNLHKTFGTPHGGGGPGAGPVGVAEFLRPYLPVPRIVRGADARCHLDYDAPRSIGPVAPFYGQFGVFVRAYAFLRMLGREGLRAVSNQAVLNARYVLEKLRSVFPPASPQPCLHECVLSGEPLTAYGVHTLDLAKALLDRGFHPPTVYFPLTVPEAIMIEPTETETRATLDRFVQAMLELAELAQRDPGALRRAPETTPVGRLDEIAAAKRLDLVYNSDGTDEGLCGRAGEQA